jgi:hypothetical protein
MCSRDPNANRTPAPRSIDTVRVIRRCLRCFAFGALGLIPMGGLGLAIQALRLRDKVEAEVGERRSTRFALVYCIAGLLLLWAADRWYGWVGDLTVCWAIVVIQSCHVWSAFLQPNQPGYPGWRELAWGVTFAYAGLSGSSWTFAFLLLRLMELTHSL